jgi:glycosyltransferase involved in cell wall biosynthesis
LKVLIVSHNVFSKTESMGKTLEGYFKDFDSNELAQFYIHSQIPTSKICKNYYRITDKDAIKSILGFKAGKVFTENDIRTSRNDSRTDIGVTASIYQRARKRTPLVYLARNLWWKLSHWNNKALQKWLDEFEPDCVFFASGDYAFMYDIARKIAVSRDIPLYVSCMDDYYFYNKNSDSLLGRFQHKIFIKTVNRTMSYAKKIFCICDKMSADYSQLFKKKCITIHTPTSISDIAPGKDDEKTRKICYLGNLGYQRDKQLIEIGRVLRERNFNPNHIDVYSSESRQEILGGMIENNGIVFHGSVGSKEVQDLMKNSLAVIHTESFDKKIRQCVKYSVSTKIADSLSSGTCIFAYGPEEIASISYLKQSNAAICCVKSDDLETKLCELINDCGVRKKVIGNALGLARKNHLPERTPKIIRKEIFYQEQ